MLYKDSNIEIHKSHKEYINSVTVDVFMINKKYTISFQKNDVVHYFFYGRKSTTDIKTFKKCFPFGNVIAKFVDNIMFQ